MPSELADAGQDVVGGLGPDEGGTAGVVRGDKLVNGRFKVADAARRVAVASWSARRTNAQ